MLVVHLDDRRFELLRSVGGQLLPVSAGVDGAVYSQSRLPITWDGDRAEV